MRTDILERKEEILSWIEEELPLREIASRLRCKHETLCRYLHKLGIEYKGQQSKKGQQKGPNKYKDSSFYTKKDSPYLSSPKLKEKLLRDGLQHVCQLCGNTHWQGNVLPIELHHIDGNHYNNEFANLQILCPNCHAISAPSSDTAAGDYFKNLRAKREELIKTKELHRIKLIKASKEIREKTRLSRINQEEPNVIRSNQYTFDITEWELRKELIFNSGVDLSKYGWKTRVQEETGLTRRQVDLTIEHFPEEFNSIIYIRK